MARVREPKPKKNQPDADEPIDTVEDEDFDDYADKDDGFGGLKPLDFND